MANTQANKKGAADAGAHLHATGTAAPALSVREKPILFNGEMVRAILDGRKTMTRRVVNPQPVRDAQAWACYWAKPNSEGCYGPCAWGLNHPPPDSMLLHAPHPVGSRAWVRETWKVSANRNDDPPSELRGEMSYGGVRYIADGNTDLDGKRRPSIHMPRWASRITLEITGVRAERLQEITEEDAKAEGAPWLLVPLAEEGPPPATVKYHGYRMAFAKLWDSLNKKPGFAWKDNPWCWCIEFRRAQ